MAKAVHCRYSTARREEGVEEGQRPLPGQARHDRGAEGASVYCRPTRRRLSAPVSVCGAVRACVCAAVKENTEIIRRLTVCVRLPSFCCFAQSLNM